jgi:hypothetical protein
MAVELPGVQGGSFCGWSQRAAKRFFMHEGYAWQDICFHAPLGDYSCALCALLCRLLERLLEQMTTQVVAQCGIPRRSLANTTLSRSAGQCHETVVADIQAAALIKKGAANLDLTQSPFLDLVHQPISGSVNRGTEADNTATPVSADGNLNDSPEHVPCTRETAISVKQLDKADVQCMVAFLGRCALLISCPF